MTDIDKAKKRRHELNEELDELRSEANPDLTRIQRKEKAYTKVRRRIHRYQRDKGKALMFETWMLNGCPNTLSDGEKAELAIAVDHGLHCTATSNGTHASGSYHYYKPCRAFDAAAAMTSAGIAQMTAYHRDVMSRHPDAREIFGPGGIGWIKNGVRTSSGTFPAHGNHNHVALA